MALDVFRDPYTIGRMAEMLAEPDFSSQRARNRLLHLAKGMDRGGGQLVSLLHSYGHHGTGKTAHRLFAFAEVCKAKVLFTLIEQGIADNSVLRAADLGLVGNRVSHDMSEAEQKAVFGLESSPIERAIFSIYKGGEANFALAYFWHPKNGQRQYRGDVVFGDDDLPLPPKGFVPRSTVLIPLRPLILPLIGKGGRERVN